MATRTQMAVAIIVWLLVLTTPSSGSLHTQASHHVPRPYPHHNEPSTRPTELLPVGNQHPTPVTTRNSVQHQIGAATIASSLVPELGPVPLPLLGRSPVAVTTAEGEVVIGGEAEVVPDQWWEARAHSQQRQPTPKGESWSWHTLVRLNAQRLRRSRLERSVLSSHPLRWWSSGLLPRHHRTSRLRWRTGRRGGKARGVGEGGERSERYAGVPPTAAAAAAAQATAESALSLREATLTAAAATREAVLAASVAAANAAAAAATAAAVSINERSASVHAAIHSSKASSGGSGGLDGGGSVTASPVAMKESRKEASVMADDPNPFTYDPNLPWSSAGKGRCTRFNITIRVSSIAQLEWRRFFPPRLTVILLLMKSLRLTTTLRFGLPYSCTVLKGGAPGVSLSISNDRMPILAIWNTSNVLIYNVSFSQPVTASSPACKTVPEIRGNGQFTCPAISIWCSYGVQLGQGSVFGRIEIARSMTVSIDSMTLSSIFSFERGVGAVRVLVSGNGPNILRSGISISNNEILGSSNGIVLHQGAVGVDIYNNYIHDFGFAGIRCGDYISSQGDCMATNIFHNYIYSPRPNITGDSDAAGIYFQTHWVNPANYATCNYVEGGDHCYYLDNAASGVTIEGGVCLRTNDGIKTNIGKGNVVKHVIQKGVTRASATIQCLFTTTFNCNQYAGKVWNYLYNTYYRTPQVNEASPFLSTVCTATTANDGKPCNPSGGASESETGKCSGLPTDNLFDLMLVNAPKFNVPPRYLYCDKYTSVSNLNNLYSMNKTYDFYQFIDYNNDNLGVSSTSPVYASKPDFRSCDRQVVGPTVNAWSSFVARFNLPKPSGFDSVIKLNFRQIQDPSFIPS